MYLVHAHFELVPPHEVPGVLRELARSSLLPSDRVEHLSVHPRSPHAFTLGFYSTAGSLAEAESGATAVCRRLLAEARWLPPARLTRVGVPLIAPALLGDWPSRL
ncbi:hypothetical protein AB0A69_09395 [Streptomyces sp. NPDC045431]|uniref:hypothetical protein n=1 Tax=Streptomyces sp. NPDC045431 TaxID=3155613 RepID=UPI0033E16635